MSTDAVACPPANLPLLGITINDHGCGVPSHATEAIPDAKPVMVVIRPTDWASAAPICPKAPGAHDAVPLTVASRCANQTCPMDSRSASGWAEIAAAACA